MSTNRALRNYFFQDNLAAINNYPARLNDLKAISTFLLDNEKVKEQLAKLEKALELAATESGRFDPVNRCLHGFKRGEPLEHNKLLSGYFKKWAAENEFQPLTRLHTILSENEFNNILSSGRLFKDSAFRGNGHGQWTHLIQWWCVTEYHKQSPFLSCKPVELYRWIGDTQNTNNFRELWFNVFELNTMTMANLDSDFLSSEKIGARIFHFLSYLISQEAEKELPVLSQLIQGRENKGIPAGPKTKKSKTEQTEQEPIQNDSSSKTSHSIFSR